MGGSSRGSVDCWFGGGEVVFRPVGDESVGAWDSALQSAYAGGSEVRFVFDLRGMRVLPRDLTGLRGVLERHRESTRRQLRGSRVVLPCASMVPVARLTVLALRPERPVEFVCDKS